MDRKNTRSRVCWPVEGLAFWLTPSVVASVIHHTSLHALLFDWHTRTDLHSLLWFRFLYPRGTPKFFLMWQVTLGKGNKCSLESINEWIRYLSLVQKSGHCLQVWGRREGRREHLPMSLPSLECSSAAHLVWADIRAGAGILSSPRELLISGSQAGVMQQTGSLRKKWSLWNDRSPLRLSQRASESKGLKEVGGWDCVPIARGFPVIVLSGRPSRDLALDVNIATV